MADASTTTAESSAQTKPKGNLTKLRHVRTPTDMRGAIGSHASTINWLLPQKPDIEREVRHAVEAITHDLQYIGSDEPELVSSYLDSIEEPLETLASLGFGLSYALRSGPAQWGEAKFDDWQTVIFVVSETPLVFTVIHDGEPSKLHILNGCQATRSNIILQKSEGTLVLGRGLVVPDWFDEEEHWCTDCWQRMDATREALKAHYATAFMEDIDSTSPASCELEVMLSEPESVLVEFKETLWWDVRRDKTEDERLFDVYRAICAMINRDGGTILIGVHDDGTVVGLERDLSKLKTHDRFQRKVQEAFGTKIKPDPTDLIRITFPTVRGICIARIEVQPDTLHPHFLLDDVYVRRDGESRKLVGADLTSWWTRRLNLKG